ncbi:MAG TPA: TRAP transporter substrate-binding protein [Azospirillaceae bacterium]|nr:TRAP transporter substrate-binding protein [Azospirillaceae bacterium]
MRRRQFVKATLGGAVAAPLVARYSGANAQAQVTLRLHHFLPATTTGQTGVFEPWAKRLAEESQNRIRVQIFPAMQLGGAPPQLFDQARDGIVDMVWTLPGYTPNRFPLIEVFELPFLAGSARATSLALAEFADKHLRQEFREVVPVGFWAHDPGHIHTRDRLVRTMEDLKGLKLRFPTRQANETLKALGADTVGMPVPAVPEALSRGTIDGAVIPWEVVPTIRVHELCKTHTVIPGTPGLYTATFILAMNRRTYENLPADLRDVLDRNRGLPFSRLAGEAWDAAAAKGRDAAAQRGNRIHELSADEVARWREATRPVVEAWVMSMQQRGVDGQALLDEARALIAKHA